jgi:hypothetical protein
VTPLSDSVDGHADAARPLGTTILDLPTWTPTIRT